MSEEGPAVCCCCPLLDQCVHTLLLQVQNAKQTNSGLKLSLEASLEELRLPEVGRLSASACAALLLCLGLLSQDSWDPLCPPLKAV